MFRFLFFLAALSSLALGGDEDTVSLFTGPHFTGQAKTFKSSAGTLPGGFRSVRAGSKVYADLFAGQWYTGARTTTYSAIEDLTSSPLSLQVHRKADLDVQPVLRGKQTLGYTAKVRLEGLKIDLAAEQEPYDAPCRDKTCPTDGGFFFAHVYPLYDPQAPDKSWFGRHPMQLMINTSFFKICAVAKYHELKCANGSGLLVSGGRKLLDASVPDDHGHRLDAAIFWKDGRVDFFRNKDVPVDLRQADVAMAGFWFFNGEDYRCKNCHDPDTRRARTALGLDETGKTLIVAVIQTGQSSDGQTGRELQSLLRGLGATRGFMLDGGGSSQFTYAGERFIAVPPGDREGYRPVPSAFGIVGLK